MAKISKFAQLLAEAHDLDAEALKVHKSDKLPYEVYFKPDDYATRKKYFNQIIGDEKTEGLLKCFFLRALDKNGKRMFLTQHDWDMIKGATTQWPGIFEVSAEMLGGNLDDLFPTGEYGPKEAEKN